MKLLIVGCYAIPVLIIIGASAAPMEKTTVILGGDLICTVVLGITCWLLGSAGSKKQRPWPVVLASSAASLALLISVMTVDWPLRAGYFLSHDALDRLAQDVRAGQPFAGPKRVGLFTVVEAEMSRHGIVCLWVDADPAGKTGFVQCGPDHVPFNLWSMVNLDGRWQFISED